MTGTVGSVTPSLGGASGLTPAPTAAPSESSGASSAAAAPFRSPQVVQDPAAGLITEYVNESTGQVLSQSPSAVAVAYLRQGLAANGLPKDGSGGLESSV